MAATIIFNEKPKYFNSKIVVFPENDIETLADRMTEVLGFNVNKMKLDQDNYILYLGDHTCPCQIFFDTELYPVRQMQSN